MITKVIPLYKPIFQHFAKSFQKALPVHSRNSHVVSYRVAPPPHSKATIIGAEVVGAAMWWWILWHLWHEYEHITVSEVMAILWSVDSYQGEFPYPDTAKWTNNELGVPS